MHVAVARLRAEIARGRGHRAARDRGPRSTCTRAGTRTRRRRSSGFLAGAGRRHCPRGHESHRPQPSSPPTRCCGSPTPAASSSTTSSGSRHRTTGSRTPTCPPTTCALAYIRALIGPRPRRSGRRLPRHLHQDPARHLRRPRIRPHRAQRRPPHAREGLLRGRDRHHPRAHATPAARLRRLMHQQFPPSREHALEITPIGRSGGRNHTKVAPWNGLCGCWRELLLMHGDRSGRPPPIPTWSNRA